MKSLILLFCSALFALGATAQTGPERPIIFLPGILGSKLYKSNDNIYDENDELLWGDRSSYRKFSQLELKSNDDIIPHGIIESVRVLGPIRVRQYKALVNHLERLGYERDKNLFLFAYDWRKSNFNSASLLNAFIDGCKQSGSGCESLADGQFDIVAHSMGGIVARIFMDQHAANGSRIKNFVTLGTPYRGSHAATQTLVEGFSGIARFMSGDQNTAKRVMLSFESGFELAPTYAYCCFIGSSWNDSEELNLGDPQAWNNFLPDGETYDVWKEHIEKGVARQAQIKAIVEKDSTTSIYAVAASNIRTTGVLLINDQSGDSSWSYTRGDGTVPILSATNAKVANSLVSMKKHAHIFEDQYVEESLWRILIAKDELIPFADEYTSCLSNTTEQCFYIGKVLARSSNLRVTPGLVATMESTMAIFDIEPDDNEAGQASIAPRLCISDASQDSASCIVNRDMHIFRSDEARLRSFTAPILLDVAGDYKAVVIVQGEEIVADYFSVIGEDE